MKIYYQKPGENVCDTPSIPQDLRTKVSVLRLSEYGVYVEEVGMRTHDTEDPSVIIFMVCEDDSDEMFLSYIKAWNDGPQSHVVKYTSQELQELTDLMKQTEEANADIHFIKRRK